MSKKYPRPEPTSCTPIERGGYGVELSYPFIALLAGLVVYVLFTR